MAAVSAELHGEQVVVGRPDIRVGSIEEGAVSCVLCGVRLAIFECLVRSRHSQSVQLMYRQPRCGFTCFERACCSQETVNLSSARPSGCCQNECCYGDVEGQPCLLLGEHGD